MATQRTRVDPSVYDNPLWPERLPDARALRLVYGFDADEMVVLFDDVLHTNPAFVYVDTPDYEYAWLKVDGVTGDVIGIMVYPLVAHAVEFHPHWRAAALPNPSPEVAERIVRDIKALYDRYGIPDDLDKPGR